MPATFILSLDCEGKWGVADALTPAHRRDLADDRLRIAYGDILRLLDAFDVTATFAFAGVFSQSAEQFARLRPAIEQLSRLAPDYLEPVLADLDTNGGSGWHGAHLADAVGSSHTRHEIALHGVTHVPWTRMDAAFVQAEMALFERLEGPVRHSRTFVYPRNLVAHRQILADHGILGFRAARPSRSRLAALLSEFDVRVEPDRPAPPSDPIAIPAGFFLNWRSGPRRLVPPAVTMLRARRLLDDAERSGGVVHYWLHPENIAIAPATLGLLRGLVEEVARLRDAGTCEVLTQREYCDRHGAHGC